MGNSDLLRTDSDDIIIGVTVVDEDGNLVSSSQGVNFNIQRLSDSKWWDTTAWTTGAEPTLHVATQVGSTGVYEYTLTGGYDDNTNEYLVRVNTTGTIIQNFYVNASFVESAIIQGIILSQGKSISLIGSYKEVLDNLETRYKALYSAIRDMRRDLLRGNNKDWRT